MIAFLERLPLAPSAKTVCLALSITPSVKLSVGLSFLSSPRSLVTTPRTLFFSSERYKLSAAKPGKISIPRFGNFQQTESLNVATATAILLSEFRR